MSTQDIPVVPFHDDSEEMNDLEALKRGKLVQDDESTKTAGSADFIVYGKSGSGTLHTVAIVIGFILVHGYRIGGDYWLRLWVPRAGGFSDQVYVGVYGVFAIAFQLELLLEDTFLHELLHSRHENFIKTYLMLLSMHQWDFLILLLLPVYFPPFPNIKCMLMILCLMQVCKLSNIFHLDWVRFFFLLF